MTLIHENTNIVFDVATEEDYLRYINRPLISALQAAFLVSGYVPYIDFKPTINSSRLHREIYEIYLYLHDSASGKSMDKSIHKDGEYFAKLQDWTGYLFHTGHSVVEPLVDAFIVHEQLGLYDETSLEPIPQGDDIPPILRAQIELLALIFPKIPYKYYMKFPLVQKILQRLNIESKRFCDIATEVSKIPRMPGRPKKNILTQYEECHPNLKAWFEYISKEIGA